MVKTTGDGLHAAFATAHDALGAAVDAQRALVAEAWPLPEPLRVRMGVHTGAAEERDGDYYGPAVNRAARRVRRGARRPDPRVPRRRGAARATRCLRRSCWSTSASTACATSPAPSAVFQLDAPGLPDRVPAAALDRRVPRQPPLRLSSFVGREHDLEAVAGALREARLVTLTGVGGVGKTRLAIQVAAELVPHFPDGAWLCELAPASDAESMVQIVVVALGITPRPGVSLQTGVLEFLAAKHLVLVLDNCEHLIDAAGLLADAVLRECPNVHILATSREGLGVEGEHMRVVRSLPLPDATADVATIAASEATRLFVERARTAQADVAFDDDAMRAIADICRRLDGIPLAIELAAARCRGDGPGRDRAAPRRALPAAHRRPAHRGRAPPHPPSDRGLVVLAPRRARAPHLRPSRRFLRLLRHGGRRGGGHRGRPRGVGRAGRGHRPRGEVDAGAASPDPTPPATRCSRPCGSTRASASTSVTRPTTSDAGTRCGMPTSPRRSRPGSRPPRSTLTCCELADDLDNLRAAVHWALDRDDPADRALALRTIAHLVVLVNWDRTLGIGTWAERGHAFVDESEPWVRSGVLAAAAEEARLQVDFDRAVPLARDALRDGVALRGFGPTVALLVIGVTLGVHGRQREAVDELLAAKEQQERPGYPPSIARSSASSPPRSPGSAGCTTPRSCWPRSRCRSAARSGRRACRRRP